MTELKEETSAHAPWMSHAWRQALLGQDAPCGLQAGVLKAVISLVRLWVQVESTKSLFLQTPRPTFLVLTFFFPLLSQPITFLKTNFESSMENLIAADHGVHSMKPSRPCQPQRNLKELLPQPWSRRRGPGGAEAWGREVHT